MVNEDGNGVGKGKICYHPPAAGWRARRKRRGNYETREGHERKSVEG
jgi:hypothetical protein